jgi:hypothetical protein
MTTREPHNLPNNPKRQIYCLQGMLDPQLARLAEVLKLQRIWAVNVGENFEITQNAWQDFACALPATAVAHLYVEENNLVGTTLKKQVRVCVVGVHRGAALLALAAACFT